MSHRAAVARFNSSMTRLLLFPWFSPLFPKLPTPSVPPSSKAVLMSTWWTAHPLPPFPPPTLRSRSSQTSARARCPTSSTTRRLWTTPARTQAPRRAQTSSATARTPSTTAPPGSSWWEGWWPTGVFFFCPSAHRGEGRIGGVGSV